MNNIFNGREFLVQTTVKKKPLELECMTSQRLERFCSESDMHLTILDKEQSVLTAVQGHIILQPQGKLAVEKTHSNSD